jgi:hypothetical protein
MQLAHTIGSLSEARARSGRQGLLGRQYISRNEANCVSTNRVAHPADFGGVRAAAAGTVAKSACGSSRFGGQILSNQLGPSLWS